MATAHLSVKIGKAGKATPHAEYISREGKYAQRLNQGEKLEATESGNMPAWARHDPLEFWKAADQHERKNGSVYREHEIALPRELTPAQRVELVREWVRQELGERHAYTWAIHNKTALDGGEQPHVHLMYSERTNDGIERDPAQYFRRYNAKHPERGGAKKANIQGTHSERAAALKAMRERWERLHNSHLARRGHRHGIDMRTLAEQGESRKPARKMTPSESAAKQRRAAAARVVAAALERLPSEELARRRAAAALPVAEAERRSYDLKKAEQAIRQAQDEMAERKERLQQYSRHTAKVQAEINGIQKGFKAAVKSLFDGGAGQRRVESLKRQHRPLKEAADRDYLELKRLEADTAEGGSLYRVRELAAARLAVTDPDELERHRENLRILDAAAQSRPLLAARAAYQAKAARLSPANQDLLAVYEKNFEQVAAHLPPEHQERARTRYYEGTAERMHGPHLDLPHPEQKARQAEPQRWQDYGQAQGGDYDLDR